MQNLPNYLTQEQQRFWGKGNWENLRIYGEKESIVGIVFDLTYDIYHDSVTLIYFRNNKVNTLTCRLDGTNGYGNKRVTEVKLD